MATLCDSVRSICLFRKAPSKSICSIVPLAAVFLLAACGAGAEDEVAKAVPEEVASEADSPAVEETALSETYVFPGFGFSIDHPAG